MGSSSKLFNRPISRSSMGVSYNLRDLLFEFLPGDLGEQVGEFSLFLHLSNLLWDFFLNDNLRYLCSTEF